MNWPAFTHGSRRTRGGRARDPGRRAKLIRRAAGVLAALSGSMTLWTAAPDAQQPPPAAVPAQDNPSAHWAFQPVNRPGIPAVRNPAWPQNPIDRFVLARLEAQGLTPSPPVDRAKLLRRVYLDLIGLPPTYEELQKYLLDSSPNALSRVVDQLLARPEYGERWARHWLDVARYADAKGYVDGGEVKYPFAYAYRDYVIKALNRDLPYDRFILEQVAADRLTDAADPGAVAALGFLTVGSRYNFFPHEIIDDRIDVVMRGFLGLTAACARCHDHKFDPISTRDYYGLYGIFANSTEPTLARAPRLSPPGAAESEAFDQRLAEAAEKYEQLRRRLHAQIQHEMRSWAGDYLRYVVQSNLRHRTEDQPRLRTSRGLIRDVAAYSKGGVVRWRSFLASRSPDDPVFGLWARLEKRSREEIPRQFATVLAEWQATGKANPYVLAAFAGQPVQSLADVADSYGALLEDTDQYWQYQIRAAPQSTAFDDARREQVRQALYGPEAPGTTTLEESENLYTLDESMQVRAHYAGIERVFLKPWEGMTPRAMVLEDRIDPVSAHVFLRGNPQNLGPRVDQRVPTLLASLRPAAPGPGSSGRLELARAIVDRANPLTARVIVNRVWEWHFGRGLVETPSDFGRRSTPPSHPELLDFLAQWLPDHGWSLKELHRLILLSATWQQAAHDRPEGRAADPENTWLWRAHRRPLDFESMRDSLLYVAGQLQACAGGLPVEKRPDDVSHQRRTIYSFVDREKLADIYRVFDFPTPDITAPKRSRTMVPQQALFLMNSPFILAQARALVGRLSLPAAAAEPSPDVGPGIVHLFRLIHARDPRPAELELARKFLVDRKSPTEDDTAARRQRWLDLAQSLIASNEFLFVD